MVCGPWGRSFPGDVRIQANRRLLAAKMPLRAILAFRTHAQVISEWRDDSEASTSFHESRQRISAVGYTEYPMNTELRGSCRSAGKGTPRSWGCSRNVSGWRVHLSPSFWSDGGAERLLADFPYLRLRLLIGASRIELLLSDPHQLFDLKDSNLVRSPYGQRPSL